MNNGVKSCAMGLVIVAAELAAFLSPVSVVPLFPLCLFGSLLTLFGKSPPPIFHFFPHLFLLPSLPLLLLPFPFPFF